MAAGIRAGSRCILLGSFQAELQVSWHHKRTAAATWQQQRQQAQHEVAQCGINTAGAWSCIDYHCMHAKLKQLQHSMSCQQDMLQVPHHCAAALMQLQLHGRLCAGFGSIQAG
jgi:D-alanine-D-alanine ligase-like ATP-grasp enzyme